MLVWKHEYDLKLWRHKQRTPNTNDHHIPLNETPPWKFSAYVTDSAYKEFGKRTLGQWFSTFFMRPPILQPNLT